MLTHKLVIVVTCMQVHTELSLIHGALCRASGPVALSLIVFVSECVCNAHTHTWFQYDADMDHTCKHDWGWGSPLVPRVGQMPLGWLVVVDNCDVGTSGNHIDIAEVATVGDI